MFNRDMEQFVAMLILFCLVTGVAIFPKSKRQGLKISDLITSLLIAMVVSIYVTVAVIEY
jgi:hypothetical protein